MNIHDDDDDDDNDNGDDDDHLVGVFLFPRSTFQTSPSLSSPVEIEVMIKLKNGMEITMMNTAPGKKTDDEKRDEDDTTASENCSKNNLRMRLRNDKQNQKMLLEVTKKLEK